MAPVLRVNPWGRGGHRDPRGAAPTVLQARAAGGLDQSCGGGSRVDGSGGLADGFVGGGRRKGGTEEKPTM